MSESFVILQKMCQSTILSTIHQKKDTQDSALAHLVENLTKENSKIKAPLHQSILKMK